MDVCGKKTAQHNSDAHMAPEWFRVDSRMCSTLGCPYVSPGFEDCLGHANAETYENLLLKATCIYPKAITNLSSRMNHLYSPTFSLDMTSLRQADEDASGRKSVAVRRYWWSHFINDRSTKEIFVKQLSILCKVDGVTEVRFLDHCAIMLLLHSRSAVLYASLGYPACHESVPVLCQEAVRRHR